MRKYNAYQLIDERTNEVVETYKTRTEAETELIKLTKEHGGYWTVMGTKRESVASVENLSTACVKLARKCIVYTNIGPDVDDVWDSVDRDDLRIAIGNAQQLVQTANHLLSRLTDKALSQN